MFESGRLAWRRAALLSAVCVNRVSKKYAGAKQAENCRHCFNHLTHPSYSYR